jgi:hypothetical protein
MRNTEDFDMALDRLEEALTGAASARARVEALDERRKQVLAALVVKHRGDGKGIGEAEHFARADPTYQAAAAEWELANYDYRKTDAAAEGKRLRFEAWRTMNATERAKMNLR